MNSEAQVVYKRGATFQMPKFMIFWRFALDRDFNLFFFLAGKNAKQGLNFFLRSSTTPLKIFGSWLTPPLHYLALSPHRSWFIKNSICQFLTFKSNLGILTLSECHEILNGGSTWCKEATVQILSKSDKVKGSKSLSQCMK